MAYFFLLANIPNGTSIATSKMYNDLLKVMVENVLRDIETKQ